MRSPLHRLLCCVVGSMLATTIARTQDVTLAANATTPIEVTAWNYITGASIDSIPAGPMAATGLVGMLVSFWPAGIEWHTESSADAQRFALRMQLHGNGSISSSSYTAFQVVLDVASPSNRAIELDLERTLTGWGTLLSPTIAIDIGNDGTFEYADLPTTTTTLTGLTAGPTPLQIAISVSSLDYSGSTNGTAMTELAFTVRPDNDLVIQQEVDSCLPGVPGFEPPVAVFADHGVDLHFTPGLLVASTVSAPTWWTPTSPLPFATACLVVPQPDILLWLPQGFAHVALPATVRPAVLHVQTVHLHPVGIVASDGYRISAN